MPNGKKYRKEKPLTTIYWKDLENLIWWGSFVLHLLLMNIIHSHSKYREVRIFTTCWLLRLNPWMWGEHLTNQFSWVAAGLLVTCLPCLLSGRASPTCALCLLAIGLMRNDGSVDVFLHGQNGFSSVGSCCYSKESSWNPWTKLCCMATGK